ncbi:ATP-binding protein [Teredinibacter sp. KSP-S5-2]|uniref:ATP-binding protein n=1 Tax=Teredinibacter sp. KSP-S5-2 TaxID=3034506 RepID=UPI002934AE3D|nr:AAA family ATPase [Teredinibacter sp. KSP-S5-2]WNO11476.1 AAA family ATPase [Teredinibacter sp. KSP-S5-2]
MVHSTQDKQPHSASHSQETGLSPLKAELQRLDRMLSSHLLNLRMRGRTSLGDPVSGAVIEEGEAEGLLVELFNEHQKICDIPTIEPPPNTRLPGLNRAAELFHLTTVERDILLLALAVEVDSRYCRLFAFLNDQVSQTRPTLGLALNILLPRNTDAQAQALSHIGHSSALTQQALLELQPGEPLANQPIKIPNEFWPYLLDTSKAPPETLSNSTKFALEQLGFDDNTIEAIKTTQQHSQKYSSEKLLYVISGDAESGRESVAKFFAAGLGKNCLTLDLKKIDGLVVANSTSEQESQREQISKYIRRFCREATWFNAAVIFENADVLPPIYQDAFIKQINHPLFILCDRDKQAKFLHHPNRQNFHITLPKRTFSSQLGLWQSRFQLSSFANNTIDLSEIAQRFGFGVDRIDSALKLAEGMQNGEQVETKQLTQFIHTACQKLRETQFNQYAEKLESNYETKDLVLHDSTQRELDLISAWVKYSPQLADANSGLNGMDGGRGLTCLFSGPPGTGKTLAAQVIANQVGFDLYRIDLSQVVNKYIGETEKNLAKLFDEAAKAQIILFFDEADTLFGKRSDVKDSHDRYANLEVGYLLQRLEAHPGLCILATNLEQNLDEAFLRRIQVNAEFKVPDSQQRYAIWKGLINRSAFSENHNLTDQTLAMIAERFEVSGGDIRNALFSASLFAAEDQLPLSIRHVVLGVWREMQKSGRIIDTELFYEWQQDINQYVA